MDDTYYYDDGNWYASTLGHFIGLLVDAGQDPAVCFRVVSETMPDDKGTFIRRIELVMLPDGYVREHASKCHGIHKTLKALLNADAVR